MKIIPSKHSRYVKLPVKTVFLVLVVALIAMTGINEVKIYTSVNNSSYSTNGSGDFTLHSPAMNVTNLTVDSEANGTYYIVTSAANITNLTLLSNVHGSVANISTPVASGNGIVIWATGYKATIYEAGIPVTLDNESLGAAGITTPYTGSVTAVTIWGIYMSSNNFTMRSTSIEI
ncbi:MAG: hypothetical protein ACP5NK_05000 [Thermoplasmata archaeon]